MTLVAAIDAELRGGTLPAHLLPTADAQWKALLAVADWHRLSAALARQFDGARTPAWVRERLGAESLRETAHSLMLDHARTQAVAALAQASVPVIPLKGSALVETIYPDSSWRSMGDLDLLVERHRHDDAVAAIVALGYQAQEHAVVPDERGHHDAKLVSGDGVTVIEIHRHVLDHVDERFDLDELWARSTPSANGSHRLAAPHDLLLHVCVHFLVGRVVRSEGALGQLRDIAWIAARGNVDWEQLADVSRRYGVAGRVRLALAVADGLGLLPRNAIFPPLSRREAAHARRFAAARVLTDRALVPLGSWTPDRAGLDAFLWWSRTHLSDVPAGELPDEDRARDAAMVSNWTALFRGSLAVLARPITTIRDVPVGTRLRRLQ